MKDESGPAFPSPNDLPKRHWHVTDIELFEIFGCGLTKRELFSAMAMQGMIAGSQGLQITVKEFAEQSLKLADALLEELKK